MVLDVLGGVGVLDTKSLRFTGGGSKQDFNIFFCFLGKLAGTKSSSSKLSLQDNSSLYSSESVNSSLFFFVSLLSSCFSSNLL